MKGFKQIRIPRLEILHEINSIASNLSLLDFDGSFTKRFKEPESIPQLLQFHSNTLKLFIKAYRSPSKTIKLPEYRNHESHELYLHITLGTVEIIDCTSKRITLIAPISLEINRKIAEFVLLIKETPTHFAFVIVRKDEKETNIGNIKLDAPIITPLPTERLFPVPKSKQPVSFIRMHLDIEEIQKRIMFIDAEYVITEGNVHSPAHITILNYDGSTVLSSTILPENPVIRYMTFITGFHPGSLAGGLPELELLSYLDKLLVGKIIIGSDLTMELKVLEIDRKKLMGIRDLSTCKTLRKELKQYNKRISLKTMVDRFCKSEFRRDYHSSLEDTEMIRKIYLEIEDRYEDDYYDVDGYYNVDESDEEQSEESSDKDDYQENLNLKEDKEIWLNEEDDSHSVISNGYDDKNQEKTDLENVSEPMITVTIPATMLINGKIFKVGSINYYSTEEEDQCLRTTYSFVPPQFR